MKRQPNRIDELERKMAKLESAMTRFDVRRPNQKSLRQGWWIGTLDGTLTQGSTAIVSIKIWSGGVLTDTTLNVTGRDVTLGVGDSITAGTKVQVRWYHNTWLVLPIAGAPPETGTPFYNNSGEYIPPYAVMYVNSGTVEVDGVRYLECIKPDTTFQTQWLVNQSSTIAYGDVGLGNWLFENPGPVMVGDLSAGWSQELGPSPGEWAVFPYRPGFLAQEPAYDTGLGVYAVAAKQRPVTRLYGKLSTPITQNAYMTSNGEFEIWFRAATLRYRTNWANLPVVFAPLLNPGDTVSAGTWGVVDWYTGSVGLWEGDFACDADSGSNYQTYQVQQQFEQFIFTGDGGNTSTDGGSAQQQSIEQGIF